MRMRISGVWSWVPTVGAVLAVGLAGPAAAEIYSWRTEDGSYAFTDDSKAIPARYRDQVQVRSSSSLQSYKRFTPKDDKASKSYEERLALRLERLRAMNASSAAAQRSAPTAPAAARETVSLRAGKGVRVDIPSDEGDEPLVTETIFVRRDGKAVVQPMRVTRRGDRIISIEKPRQRQWNLLSDVYDEEDLGELE